jgi:nitrite reductase (NADH) small subunit
MNATEESTPVRHWIKVGALADIPRLGARVVQTAQGDIAVFRNAEDEVFALRDRCPHKGGPLSQGIVFGRHVACPLHNWSIGLADGQALAPDVGCAPRYAVKVEDSQVFLEI